MRSPLKKRGKDGKLHSTGLVVEKVAAPDGGPLLAWTRCHVSYKFNNFGEVHPNWYGFKQVVVTHRIFKQTYKTVGPTSGAATKARVRGPLRLIGLALNGNFDVIWRPNSFVADLDDSDTSILESLRAPSSSWWVNADGVLERVATKYEAAHAEYAPRAGWVLRSAAEVEQLIDQRRSGPKPAGTSVLDEEHEARQKERRRASKERKVEKLAAQLRNWERKRALAGTKVKKLARSLACAKRALENEP